eukprot:CAMPEP_0172522030 /NCGR_PEP_ID=MMETSP1066-20121228/292904_1 /TAXON_ID=671091 /ORGANISM="Coscinodiscus wailesii, Strain CCMP2513" /LENGTH=233 /DNA_ID=CAMNT_0013304997 /DNA_START=366 /DNA_END=1063 /DNA_ORIENTATION=+
MHTKNDSTTTAAPNVLKDPVDTPTEADFTTNGNDVFEMPMEARLPPYPLDGANNVTRTTAEHDKATYHNVTVPAAPTEEDSTMNADAAPADNKNTAMNATSITNAAAPAAMDDDDANANANVLTDAAKKTNFAAVNAYQVTQDDVRATTDNGTSRNNVSMTAAANKMLKATAPDILHDDNAMDDDVQWIPPAADIINDNDGVIMKATADDNDATPDATSNTTAVYDDTTFAMT